MLLLLPAVIVGSPATSPFLLLIPVLWLLRKRETGRFFPPTPLDVSLLLLLLMVLVSLYATFDIAFSFPKVAGVVYGVALYYTVVAAAGRSPRALWIGAGLFLVSGLGIVGLSLMGVQWSTKLPILGGVVALLPERALTIPGRSYGINPNEVAGVLLWIVPLALALAATTLLRYRALRTSLGRRRALLILAFLLALAAILAGTLLLTQSRGGLLGFAVSLLFLLVAGAGRYRRWALLALALLVVAAAVVLFSGYAGAARALLFEQAGVEASAESAINTLEGRREIWSRALYGIQDFPFTGMGMNTFRRVVHILYPLFLISPDTDIAHAHNHLLQTALDLGLPGLIAYLALWLGTAGMLWSVWHAQTSIWIRALAVGLAASLLGYFVYGITDAVALGARPGFIFWALLGLSAAAYRVARYPQSVEIR